MLQVEEQAARLQQAEDFLVQFSFSGIGQVMNGEARHRNVERSIITHRVQPRSRGQILNKERGLPSFRRDRFPGRFDHWLREVEEYAAGVGMLG